jgi:hypothetical protein
VSDVIASSVSGSLGLRILGQFDVSSTAVRVAYVIVQKVVGFGGSSDAYQTITENLAANMMNGMFSSSLQEFASANGVSVLKNVTSSQLDIITSTSPTPAPTLNTASDSIRRGLKVSLAFILEISAGALVFCVGVVFGIWYLCTSRLRVSTKKKNREYEYADSWVS